MKLKSILGVGIVSLLAALFTVPVMAADYSYSYKIGAPIDLSTNAKVTEYKAGMYLALPVDFITPSGKSRAETISLNFDNIALTYGINDSEAPEEVWNNMNALGIITNNNDGVDYVVDALYTIGRGGIKSPKGQIGVADTNSKGTVDVGWAFAGDSIDINADSPELYILFKVNAEVDDEKLNHELFKVNEKLCNVADDTKNATSITGEIDPATKANICSGAFQVVIDNSKTSAKWIQKLYVKDNDKEYPITYYVEDGNKITFPVRVNSINTADKIITIYAATSTDKNGEVDAQETELGSVTLKLDGSVKSYADNEVNY